MEDLRPVRRRKGAEPDCPPAEKERVLCSSMYAYRKFGITHSSLDMDAPCRWTSSTRANMLENELYLGNTLNMKHGTRSCKDKRRVKRPSYRIWRRQLHRQSEAVYRHHGADPGTAAGVHREDRGA